MEPKVDEVISTYLRLRSKKEKIEAEVKDKVSGLKTKMEKIESWLQRKADAEGVTSFSAKGVGTAFVTKTDYANVSDWDAVLDFIKENDSYEMLERRVSKKAVRDYIQESKAVPPGITYGTRVGVNIRKANAGSAD